MVKLAGALSNISSKKILIAGDLMYDYYTIGKARRISPEAPVVVVEVLREEGRPGGAGNVMLNLKSMGANVVCLARIGRDANGGALREALSAEEIDIRGLMEEPGFPTPCKNRVIAEGQQIVRVDYEKNIPLSEQLEQKIIDSLPALLKDVDLVALSDYGKGFLTRTLISAIIQECQKRNILVITDPKGIDFTKYEGTYLIKPNLGEAYAAAGLSLDYPLEMVAGKLLEITQAELLMITRSELGISLFHKNGQRMDFPVQIHEVRDVTGAGDTVLAIVALSIASGLTLEETASLSNVAAGIAIERFGCARVTLSDIAHRLLKNNVVNKVFDQEHIFALKEVLRGTSYSLIVINETSELSNALFKNLKEATSKISLGNSKQVIVYVNQKDPKEEFINILASLSEIDFVLVQMNSLKSIYLEIEPLEMYAISENGLSKIEHLDKIMISS